MIKVNTSKLRKDHNPLEHVHVPLDPLAMYLTTDADRVDPQRFFWPRMQHSVLWKVLAIGYSNSPWMPVTSGPMVLELCFPDLRVCHR